MNDLTLNILFNDGATETITRVDYTDISNGVLHVWRQDVYRTSLGHWPLLNIRKWTAD